MSKEETIRILEIVRKDILDIVSTASEEKSIEIYFNTIINNLKEMED